MAHFLSSLYAASRRKKWHLWYRSATV